MSFTKKQISNFLNDNILFRFSIDEDYLIKFNEHNELLKFDEVERIVESNLKYWNSILKESSNDFTINWQNLYDKIVLIRKYFDEIEYLDLNDINNYLYSYLSSSRELLEPGGFIYILSVNSPIDRDESFRKIKSFVTYYVNQTENNLTEAVKIFVKLSKNMNLIGSYLSNGSDYSFYPALYLLRKSFSNIKENVSDFENNIVAPLSKKLESISDNSDEMYGEITAFVEAQHNEISQHFKETILNLEEFQKSVNNWQDDKKKKLNELEETYKEKLSLEAPEQLWNNRAKEYRIQAIAWTFFLIFVVVSLIWVTKNLVLVFHNYSLNIIKDVPFISESFIFISVISFFIYIIRILIKIVMSNHHLAAEYKQKAALTRFYQSLIKAGTNIDKEERLIIINSLFSRVDTGLVKSDSSNDNDTIWAILSKNLK